MSDEIKTNNEKLPTVVPFGVKARGGFFSTAEFKVRAQPFLGLGGPISAPQGGLGTVITTAPIFYDIRYFTPDKFYFPRQELEQNDIWRLIYKRDPIVGAAIDLYAEFAWSNFDLVGIDDTAVRSVYENTVANLNLLSILPDMTKEFLIIGKVIPHLIFSEKDGIWKHVFIHDPDYIKMTVLPFANEEPILDLKVPPELRQLVISPDPRIQKIVAKLPESMVTAILSSQFIPLDNLNVTVIPRRAFASDWRGISILERLYRMLMFEDFLMNAALAVAQRNAVPLRIFKLGDHKVDWYPTKEDENALSELLAIAEADPMSALIMHSGIEVEYVGVSDRFWNVAREWDFIENIKLVGLGVSKSFLMGEASFASAVAGLQTFVQKVAGLRMKFENEWIVPKIFKTIAKIHKFYKRTPAELSYRIRLQKEDSDLLYPVIKWHRSLEPTQDTSLLSVWRELHDKGIISDRTYAAGAGLNLDVERQNKLEEEQYKKKIETMVTKIQSQMGNETGYHVPSKYIHASCFDKQGFFKGVHYSELEPVIAFIKGHQVDEFKGIDNSLSSIYHYLREKNWDDKKLDALTELLKIEKILVTPDKIYEEIEKETLQKDFLSGK